MQGVDQPGKRAAHRLGQAEAAAASSATKPCRAARSIRTASIMSSPSMRYPFSTLAIRPTAAAPAALCSSSPAFGARTLAA